MAAAIADNLQDAGFDRVDVDPAEAQITIVETIDMPEPSDEIEQVKKQTIPLKQPPLVLQNDARVSIIFTSHLLNTFLTPSRYTPSQVIVVQQEFSGIDADQAQSEEFQEAVEQAVADELNIGAGDVEVTSVTVDDEGDVTVVYVVQNVDPEDVEEMQEQLESGDMADAIGDNLQDNGFDGADVEEADSAPATVEVTQEPVIEAQQEIAGGVTLEQAQGETFQDAFEEAVAEQLGVDAEDVDITSVETDEKGAVIVTYQVSDVDPLDQIAVEKAVESDAMADVIADNLQDVGFDNADVESADAEITTAEVRFWGIN